MSKLLSVLIAATFAVVTYSAVAAEGDMAPATPPTAQKKMHPQQAKMKNCNKEAKAQGLKKDERKVFMKSCLKKDKQGDMAPAAE